MAIPLTDRFEDALVFAFQLHKNQYRKQSKIPYISHLLAVTAIVLENGGSENQAIAALLHDAVEDQGGYDTLHQIKSRFGEEVELIVEGCTDAYVDPKPDWKERKSAYLEKIKQAEESVLLVSLADKVHNARSILKDLQSNEINIWDKFNGGKEGTLWYYKSLLEIFESCPYQDLLADLRRTIEKIIKLAD